MTVIRAFRVLSCIEGISQTSWTEARNSSISVRPGFRGFVFASLATASDSALTDTSMLATESMMRKRWESFSSLFIVPNLVPCVVLQSLPLGHLHFIDLHLYIECRGIVLEPTFNPVVDAVWILNIHLIASDLVLIVIGVDLKCLINKLNSDLILWHPSLPFLVSPPRSSCPEPRRSFGAALEDPQRQTCLHPLQHPRPL